MDLEVEEKIPQTGVLILFPPAHSLLVGYSRRRDHGSPNPTVDQILGTVTSLIYLLQGFFKFYLLHLLSRVLFAFFELMCVGIWL